MPNQRDRHPAKQKNIPQQNTHANTPQVGVMQAQFSVEQRSSALPSAEELERLEILAPGVTNRFLNLLEEQAHHIMENNRMVLEANIASQNRYHDQKRLDTILAFILGIFFLIAVAIICWVLVIFGKNPTAASIVAGSAFAFSMATIITAFVRRRPNREIPSNNQE